MIKNVNYHYYVEGENEKCIINVLKTNLRCIVPGKVEKFNVIQNTFTFTQSKSEKDFKRDLLECSNVDERLKKCGFSIEKF